MPDLTGRILRAFLGQGRQDSNLQPPVLETGALPIELRPSAGAIVSLGTRSPTLRSVARGRRSSLGVLFIVLAAVFAAVALAAAGAGGPAWAVAFAAGALAAWMGEQAFRALR